VFYFTDIGLTEMPNTQLSVPVPPCAVKTSRPGVNARKNSYDDNVINTVRITAIKSNLRHTVIPNKQQPDRDGKLTYKPHFVPKMLTFYFAVVSTNVNRFL